MLATTVCQRPAPSSTWREAELQRQAALARGQVVARERVVGPAGQEQQRSLRRLAQVQREGMLFGVAADAEQGEAVRVSAIDVAKRLEHVAAAVVAGLAGRAQVACRVETERPARGAHEPFVREDLESGGMGDRDELTRSRKRTSSSSLVTRSSKRPSLATSWSSRRRTHSSGTGAVPRRGRARVAHLAAAHEIGDELEAARRSTRTGRGRTRACGRAPDDGRARAVRLGDSSACSVPEGQRMRMVSAPARVPNPNSTSAGAERGVVADGFEPLPEASRAHLDLGPHALRLLTRPLRSTRSERLRLPPSLRQTRSSPDEERPRGRGRRRRRGRRDSERRGRGPAIAQRRSVHSAVPRGSAKSAQAAVA